MRPSRYILSFVAVICGCMSPPKPPEFKGEYRPINQIVPHKPAQSGLEQGKVFDFAYEGDIGNVLFALQQAQPQLDVLPALGSPTSLPVRVKMQNVLIEDVLQAIGEQGANVADVVWIPQDNLAFIRYRLLPVNKKGAK